MVNKNPQTRQPGPNPEHLKLEGDWEDQVGEVLKRPKPEPDQGPDWDDEAKEMAPPPERDGA